MMGGRQGQARNPAAVTASTSGGADAGARVLRAGGNAFDAAVAAALATCVSDPGNTGIGGYGGNMVARRSDGATVRVDFNTWAPGSIPLGDGQPAFPELGPKATSMPNNLAGFARILEDFGTMSWGDVVGPAIALARDGVTGRGSTINAFMDSRQHSFLDECFEMDWGEADGRPTLRFRQPALARSLETLAERGPGWFYEGAFAEAACAAMGRGGVEISRDEWAAIPETVFVERAHPLNLGIVTLHGSALRSSGAPSTLANVYAAKTICERGDDLESPAGLTEMARRMAAVWQYRFATPKGNEIEEAGLVPWIEAALAHPPGRTPLRTAVGPNAIGHTAHLNTLDHEGTAVSLTFTHGFLWFGGAWAVAGTGVIMNSGMLSFNWTKPVPQAGRNFAVCNISPVVGTDRAGNVLALGCPGGRRIPARLGLALARHYFAGKSPQAAVSSGRIHVEDGLLAKAEPKRLPAPVLDALRRAFPEVGSENTPGYNSPMSAIRLSAGGAVEIGLDDRETPAWGHIID
jgi:gamma-glutamyltranspeptidase / glutathione hydrolase